jgi:hypothetical protein
LIVLIAGCFSACKLDLPTSSEFSDTEKENTVKAIWSPYIGIHPFSVYENIQQPHLLKLINAGALKGARVELRLDSSFLQYFVNWLQGNGVEVLGHFWSGYIAQWHQGIISTEEFLGVFDQMVLNYPSINIWQIGGELAGGPTFNGIAPEEAMTIFRSLFYHVKQNFPHITLISPAVEGNGRGADRLRRMIDAGLGKLCEDGLSIVSIHFYSWDSTRLAEFKSQISRLSAHVRIWITEVNDMPPHWNTQIGFVKEMYPKLKRSLRVERMYWYIFSEGRDFYGGEFGLVKGLADGPPLEYSPLMNLLIGNTDSSSVSDQNSDIDSFGKNPFDVSFPQYMPARDARREERSDKQGRKGREAERQ